PDLARRTSCNLDRKQEVCLDVATRLLDVEVRKRRVVRARSGDEDVVDLTRQSFEELRELVEVDRVEGRGAYRAQLARSVLEAFGIAAGQHDVGTLRPRASRSLEPDTGTASDDDDRLPGQLRVATHVPTPIRCSDPVLAWSL